MSPRYDALKSKNAEPAPKERVYLAVRQDILIGTYPAGTFIEEERISLQNDVSRTPVREAFARLHAEHYIELVPRRGAMVKHISVEELGGLFPARLLVEQAVATIACASKTRPSAAMRDALRHLQSFSNFTRPDDQVEYLAADWEFHASLVGLSGNSVLLGMYNALRSQQERVGMTARLSSDDLAILDEEHSAIYNALAAHDAEDCQKWLSRHLAASAPRGLVPPVW